MPLQDKILNGLRTLLGWSGKPTSRRRPKRRLTEQYNVLLNVVHPVAEENEDVKLASGYVDTGFRLDKFKLEEVDGSEVTIHGSIRYHFVRENLPNLVGRIIPVPDNAPAVQVVSGNEVKVLGWLPIDCLAEQETKTVRLPRARWTMNCLVIEVDSNVEDVLIGTTAIKQWRLLTGSAWTLFMLGRLRPSHTPSSGMSAPVCCTNSNTNSG
jgi:hypothetical protein